jgi:branched-chain amino acid transport system substrate-binding protein
VQLTTSRNRIVAGVMAVSLAGGITACGTSNSAGSASVITIGASIPLTGALANFGVFEQWGYQHAVAQVNDAGGITVDGKKLKVNLVILDDQSDPNTTVNNMQKLITQNNVDAVLGSCTDSLVEPGALIADRKGVPMVTACAATDTFGAAKKWTWAWDLFFDSNQLTETPFTAADELGLATNKKVAIIHSNGPNETVIGDTGWPKWAAKHGWTVTYNTSLAQDTSNFASAIQAAKASGADMLLSVFPPPAAITLRKQLASTGYTPKILAMEEGGEPEAFAQALGNLANGVWVGGYWDPSFPYPGASDLRTQFEQQTGQTFSQHIADTDTAAQILLDAIAKAGTLDKSAVNKQIGLTDKTYPVGPIKFDANHTSTLPMVEEQWQNGKNVVIAPKDRATAQVLFPMPAS